MVTALTDSWCRGHKVTGSWLVGLKMVLQAFKKDKFLIEVQISILRQKTKMFGHMEAKFPHGNNQQHR